MRAILSVQTLLGVQKSKCSVREEFYNIISQLLKRLPNTYNLRIILRKESKRIAVIKMYEKKQDAQINNRKPPAKKYFPFI